MEHTKQAASTAETESFSLKAIIPPLLAIIVGMIMVILDSTVVNVAIPNLTEYFNADLKTIQWTITGYTLALSAVIPLAGWMTDRFGSKRVFVGTVVMFVIGSVLCSIAQTPVQLIIYRVIQGLGGGMVAPIGMAMVFRLAPPERRGSIMGMLGIPMLLAPALGPILSGWLIEYVSWHWIFLINLPIGILAVILGVKYLPNTERHDTPHLDLLGIILAPIAFSMLAYGVNEGGGTGWSTTPAITGLTIGGVALLLFIIVELRQKNPLLELRVFGSSDFTRGIFVSWVTQAALFGSMLFVPLYLQNVRQFTPLETGLILLPQALASGIGMPLGGRLFDKIGARPLAFVGLSIISTALFLLSNITADTSLPIIMVCLVLMGLGMGLTMMPVNTHVLNAAPRHLVGRVTPLTTAAQQVIVSFSVAGMTGYLTTQINEHLAAAGKGGNPLAAAVMGFDDVFLLSACIAAAGVVISLILRKPKVNSSGDGKFPQEDGALLPGH
ncbi:drug resistance transporter, EmrB/QacA subfamily [Paenibacillus sophorae]|uniref:DHA2 family efflux MFS transporter permease subunit n=1 Tax=Paenibacillus sophorae TaxID=1333845 RepID=A0A1H8NNZ1_9BACL|nr:DHA2 family efflux MFS transporter permease subunit [Paenibacillus sophorae]QWU14525.1 DHA2 family efflux MFS transporter permease subunit [Paenibacillus sophorae]SEO31277.1 drug resistance transporter, EmrB/QacA subfamily [Paenibacillus sophorae]